MEMEGRRKGKGQWGCPLDVYQIPMQHSLLGRPGQMCLSRSGLSGVSAETKGQMGKGERI